MEQPGTECWRGPEPESWESRGEKGLVHKPDSRSRTAGESELRVRAEAEGELIASKAGEAR